MHLFSPFFIFSLEEAFQMQIQVCCSPAQNRIFSVCPLLMDEIQGLNPTCHLPSPASPVQPKGSIVLAGSNHSAYFSGPHPGKALVHVGAMHILHTWPSFSVRNNTSTSLSPNSHFYRFFATFFSVQLLCKRFPSGY